MKKIIRLTESDLIRLVKRVIKEQDENNSNQTNFCKVGNKLTIEVLDGLVIDLTTNKKFTKNGKFVVNITNSDTKLFELTKNSYISVGETNKVGELITDIDKPGVFSCLDIKKYLGDQNKGSWNPFKGLY